MKRCSFFYHFFFFVVVVFISCSKSNPTPTPPVTQPAKPTITSIDISEGITGTIVTITGTNFSTTPNDDLVSFNGVLATVSSATSTQLTVTVPNNAGTGAVTVKVNGNEANGPTFTYLAQLTVTALNVLQGPLNTPVTITGTGFSTTGAHDQVTFNGKPATVTAATSTTLNVTVPASAGTGKVMVKVDGHTATGPIFTYQFSTIVSTFAGNGDSFYADGTGTASSFDQPQGIAIDKVGNLYVADEVYNLIRKITPQAVVTTIAGNTGVSHGNQNGNGTAATFFGPTSIAIDKDGTLFIVDAGNRLIRKMTTDGTVSTFAGNASATSTDGQGAAASFKSPHGICIGPSGNMYITDNDYIRKISPTGVVTTIAGTGTDGSADGNGLSASFNTPWDITADSLENLYVSDNRSRIRKISTTYQVSTFAGSASQGAKDGTGTAATFNYPYGLAFGPDGNLYVTDGLNNKIRKITPAGVVTTFAGTGAVGENNGSANTATFNTPSSLVFDSTGALYVTDLNIIRKIISQ